MVSTRPGNSQAVNSEDPVWRRVELSNTDIRYVCKLCNDGIQRQSRHRTKHLQSHDHLRAEKKFKKAQRKERKKQGLGPLSDDSFSDSSEESTSSRRPPTPPPRPSTPPSSSPAPPEQAVVQNALEHLLASVAYPEGPKTVPTHLKPPSPPAGFPPDWDIWGESVGSDDIRDHYLDEQTQRVTRNMLEHFRDASPSAYAPHYPSSADESEASEPPERIVRDADSDCSDEHPTYERPHGEDGTKRQRTASSAPSSNKDWFPWHDRVTCTLDILMHLPRSVFSHRQLDLFLWLLRVNGVDAVPSVRQMQGLNSSMQSMCGLKTHMYTGRLGNTFYVNDLGEIIAQELANPRVANILSFYPEDSSPALSEARQAHRWLNEVPSELTTPCLRVKHQLFFTFEPVLLRNRRVCMPHRWFLRRGTYYGRCWDMREARADDGARYWVVDGSKEYEVAVDNMMKTFEEFAHDVKESEHEYPYAPPTDIREFYNAEKRLMESWELTNPAEGNPWRVRGHGRRVLSFPIWLYCDDTSGNQSKKWNAHNSFLFTAAGLPRTESQQEYNVHFLCTSNVAQPLEMLDAIVEQLEKYQKEGVWAWDASTNEPVLLLPFVLAMLGDNPMQSEFASHIGLRGRRCCRTCWTTSLSQHRKKKGRKGNLRDSDGDESSDDDDEDPVSDEEDMVSDSNEENSPTESDASSAGSSVDDSNTAAPPRPTMVHQIKSELDVISKISPPRTRVDTMAQLRSYWEDARQVGQLGKIKRAQTKSGIKCKFQTHFLNTLAKSYSTKRKENTRQAALDAKLRELALVPRQTINPVWRIKGFDAHSDTPVEVLHVLLLGHIKYFWKDAIAQMNTHRRKKATLAARLSSVEVSGLGLSRLPGETMVKYSGSLVGRDFRAIAQVAPFVLQGLVSKECYNTWTSLSKLVPLVWQPEIDNLNDYLRLLTREIEQYLLRVAAWNARWFHKPKFHILLHLPDHIRRLGPAMLFATEAFESFNAVIRAKSIHSNRQAPSRDIALAFAQGNRIRHLLSGGFVCIKPADANSPIPISINPASWVQAGTHARALVARGDSALSSYLGLKARTTGSGICESDGRAPQRHDQLLSSQLVTKKAKTSANPSRTTTGSSSLQDHPTRPESPPCNSVSLSPSSLYQTCKSTVLKNGDPCELQDFVVARFSRGPERFLRIGRVSEIVKARQYIPGPPQPDGILVQHAKALATAHTNHYRMPYLSLVDKWTLCAFEDVLCTVNVQHPCANNGCGETGSEVIRQERRATAKTRQKVEHLPPHHIYVLNTAQMRDARLVQRFRHNTPALNREQTLFLSAERLMGERIAKDKAVKSLARSSSGPSTARKHRQSTTAPTPEFIQGTSSSRPQSRSRAATTVPNASPRSMEAAPASTPGALGHSRLRHKRIHDLQE